MSDILLMTAAALFIGTESPDASKHLQIENLTLPTLEFETMTHTGGGAPMGVEFNMGVLKPLAFGFKLAGFDQEAYAAAGVGSNAPKIYTARGVIQRKSDGRKFAAVATIKGCMGKVAPDQYERAKGLGHDHSIVEVTRYKLEVGDKVWYDVDFFTGKRVQFGIDETAEERQMLGLA
ncbi:MAG: hypothetical protein ABS99_00800 [Acetobacteraceae bacterium SCN 69-10]|nr:MAG: hypothetical protein ABS99_00800 [Acetobacteraceae bacterium SCN 69-10]